MQFDRDELEEVRQSLVTLDEGLNELMEQLGKQQSVNITSREKVAIQASYKRIKDTLRDAYRETSTLRGEASLNAAERAFWAPTVHRAYTELSVPITTTDREKLYSCLYDARSTVGQARHGIEGLLAEN